jgi:hypothetical protein
MYLCKSIRVIEEEEAKEEKDKLIKEEVVSKEEITEQKQPTMTRDKEEEGI